MRPDDRAISGLLDKMCHPNRIQMPLELLGRRGNVTNSLKVLPTWRGPSRRGTADGVTYAQLLWIDTSACDTVGKEHH